MVHNHDHELTERVIVNDGWNCSQLKNAGKCFSGLTGFYQSDGLRGWECRDCDFDICEKCIQVDLSCDCI